MRAGLVLVLAGYSSCAFADGAQPQGNPFGSFVMIGFMFILMYLFMIRPQNKRAKEHQNLMEKLKVGDEVVTASGILGQITKLNEKFVVLSLAEGFEVKLQKSTVAATMPKGTLKSI